MEGRKEDGRERPRQEPQSPKLLSVLMNWKLIHIYLVRINGLW